MKKLLLTLALILFASAAQAAVTTNSIVTAQTPKLAVVQFLQGTDVAGTYKTLYTAGSNGTKVSGLWSNTNDASAAHLVTCQRFVSTTAMGGDAANVPVSSGSTAAALVVNLMSQTVWLGLPVDGNQNAFFYLNAGDTLQCTFATAITGTDVLSISGEAWQY